MPELADIFRRHGPRYRAAFQGRMPPSHRRAMRDIEGCRTEALGGHAYRRQGCGKHIYSYHSCKNRHCPKCQNPQTTGWIQKQSALLLPVPYFLLTFTLPQELRLLARAHQKSVYGILFRTSAASLKKLACDPKYLGGEPGMVGVLHTWTRNLAFHPHVHYLVAGGALSRDGEEWMPTTAQDYLVPVKALSLIFRAKFRRALQKAGLPGALPEKVWRKAWVVHCLPVGSGKKAIQYLAAYVYRVALSNSRIEKLQDGKVTFRYRKSGTRQCKRTSLEANEFMRRFLQHVLPKGFAKIRYYGFLSSTKRKRLAKLQAQLAAHSPADDEHPKPAPALREPLHCPHCGGRLSLLGRLSRQRGPP